MAYDGDRDDRGFLRTFIDDYKGILGIFLFIIVITVITDPGAIGKWYQQLVAGFTAK